MNGVPPPLAGTLHILSVVSRSGRAAAEIHRFDIDDTDDDLAAVAGDAASRVYSRLSDPERHQALATAILEAIEAVEAIPGQPVTAEAQMPDGRRARATRIISP